MVGIAWVFCQHRRIIDFYPKFFTFMGRHPHIPKLKPDGFTWFLSDLNIGLGRFS